MPYIKVRGTQLFYQDWGTGRPVIFVHGWAIGGGCWEYQALPLSTQGFRCISYDQRGCGRSDDPGKGFDYDTLSDDLAALIEALDLRDVCLVSHSMGGGVVTRYLTRHGGERIARIILAATTTPFPRKSADNLDGIDAEIGEALIAQMCLDRPHYVASIASSFFGVGLPDCHTSPEIIQWGIRLTLQASAKASVEMFRSSSGTDQRAELTEITVPALIIHGDQDQNSPIALTGQKTASLIPGSRFVVYEGAPHGLLLTHTDRFNSDLVSFLQE